MGSTVASSSTCSLTNHCRKLTVPWSCSADAGLHQLVDAAGDVALVTKGGRERRRGRRPRGLGRVDGGQHHRAAALEHVVEELHRVSVLLLGLSTHPAAMPAQVEGLEVGRHGQVQVGRVVLLADLLVESLLHGVRQHLDLLSKCSGDGRHPQPNTVGWRRNPPPIIADRFSLGFPGRSSRHGRVVQYPWRRYTQGRNAARPVFLLTCARHLPEGVRHASRSWAPPGYRPTSSIPFRPPRHHHGDRGARRSPCRSRAGGGRLLDGQPHRALGMVVCHHPDRLRLVVASAYLSGGRAAVPLLPHRRRPAVPAPGQPGRRGGVHGGRAVHVGALRRPAGPLVREPGVRRHPGSGPALEPKRSTCSAVLMPRCNRACHHSSGSWRPPPRSRQAPAW